MSNFIKLSGQECAVNLDQIHTIVFKDKDNEIHFYCDPVHFSTWSFSLNSEYTKVKEFLESGIIKELYL